MEGVMEGVMGEGGGCDGGCDGRGRRGVMGRIDGRVSCV